MEQTKKFAVLIDADNTSHANIEVILEEIAKFGTASVKRIYGDWGVESLKNWQDKLLPFAITPVQQFSYIKGKDSTDMKLVIDAMDLLYAGALDGFCIVSSDSDFTPLVSRIRESGRLAYGFGRRNTASSFISACDKFIYVENLAEIKEDRSNEHKGEDDESAPVAIDQQTLQLIYKAISENANDSGWANLASVGKYINSVKSDFDCRTYGSATLSKLIKKLPVFDIEIRHSGAFVRKFGFSKFLKHLENTLAEQGANNRLIEISKIAEKIRHNKNSNYNKLSKQQIEEKIKAINSKHFILSKDKSKIKRVNE